MSSAIPLLDPEARLVIAHRGNRVRSPENTIVALDDAVALGADAVEFDVRLTRDGTAVLLHDAHLDRTTDGHGPLSEYTLAEIHTLDASRTRPGSPRAVIPTLEEVLDRFQRTPMVIEVKELQAVDPTERLVRGMRLEDRVVVGSADADVMARFYRSGLRTCASMRDAIRLIPRAALRLRSPKPAYDVLSVTPRFRGLPIPVKTMARAARRMGVPTHVWTVNDPESAKALWRAGVAGVVTDDPAAMIRARGE